MPSKTPKACRHRGCYKPTIEKHGYCADHAGEAIGWRKVNISRGNADRRGYGYAWRKLRSAVMRRDSYLCRVCADQGIATPATAVDHIINKAAGGTDDLANLQAICDACHAVKTQQESAAHQHGAIQGVGGV